MNSACFQLMIPLAAFAINLLVQIFGVRYVPKLTLLKSIIFGFAFGLTSLLCLELWGVWRYALAFGEGVSLLGANLLCYSALGYCYFHFINLGETARRIRVLRELYEAEAGLSYSKLLERYNARQIVGMRLGRLLNNKQIIEHEGSYFIGSPIMLFMAKTIVTCKFLILGKKSEFD